jgi:hypothetical protein
MRAIWARWPEAWAVRRNLASLAVMGGTQHGFEPDMSVAAEVAKPCRFSRNISGPRMSCGRTRRL